MANRTFYYQFCEQGHLRCGLTPLDHNPCTSCSSGWVIACPSCQTKLPALFSSKVNWQDQNEPVKKPPRPEHCRRCGAAMPWRATSLQESTAKDGKTPVSKDDSKQGGDSLLGILGRIFRGGQGS